ncbi:MAG TPA: type II secretion system major pseudopilin GspG [Lautropia sp.]|nr:type II secretion system major pseudopilin GspG [Lautropia sp.]
METTQWRPVPAKLGGASLWRSRTVRSEALCGYGRSPRGDRPRQRGFTLIELMVVIMILGVLAALVVPRVMTRPDEARAIAARQDIAQIMQQLRLYRLDNSRYPTSEQGIAALVTRPTSGPVPNNWKSYLDKVPNDPWGKPYQYLNPGIRGEIDVFSLGADGQTGGTGADADIGNWDL